MTPLEAEGAYCWKIAPDGRIVTVIPLTYGRARITIGPANSGGYDEVW